MSYEHGTSHFNLPQTVGSDTRDWFDTNEAFADIDAAIYSAGQTAEQSVQDLTEVKGDVQNLKDADIAMASRIDGIDSRVGASEQAIGRLEQEVADMDTDLMDAICASKEASATAAYEHLKDTFFWYNDTLYKATVDIGVGNQIVPNTNCNTTNITAELLSGGGGGGAEIDDSVISATKVWSSYKTNGEIESATAIKVGDTRFYSGKLQYWTGSAWVDAQIGGAMPILDWDNPITITSGSAIASDGYILGTVGGIGDASGVVGSISINSHKVFEVKASYQAYGSNVIPLLKVSAGDVITGTVSGINLYQEV